MHIVIGGGEREREERREEPGMGREEGEGVRLKGWVRREREIGGREEEEKG